jgi:glycosyltransferase involved in cell wall biosynthesis
LLKVCRQQRVAIWHGHDYKTNALGLLLKRFHRMRLVTTVHGWVHHTTRTPMYYKVDRWCLPRYEKVFCVSDDLHTICRDIGVKDENNILLENGIDTVEYTRRRTTGEAKALLGYPVNELLVGAVGRLEPEKAFELLIRAIHRLNDSELSVRLVIVGEGHDRSRLEGIATELGIADRVQLVGWQSDVRGYFEAMDLFVLSSLREGLPNVLLEAMALKVPCVATRIAGIPKLITDGRDGRLVSPNDLDELTRAVHELLTSDRMRAEFRTAARETIETRYSFAARIGKIARVYDEMLGA